MPRPIAALLFVLTLIIPAAGQAADISGAGATFPYPLYAKWSESYKAQTGTGINYQSIGSGGGIAQIKARTVAFGASDMPLKSADLDRFGLLQFPTVIGGVVPVVNIPGIKPGQLVLDGSTLAGIFLGHITRWNDPAIKKLNPSLNLPALSIAVVHRSDGSGTSFVFTSYLARVNSEWAEEIGAAPSVEWPVGLGAKGNEGIAANVSRAKGAIGYVEYAYAKKGGLAFARMKNRAGQVVSPGVDSFRASAAKANWTAQKFYVLLVDQADKAAWPLSSATFVLVQKKPSTPASTQSALKFFAWALDKGDAQALALDYVPLPDTTVLAIRQSLKQDGHFGF